MLRDNFKYLFNAPLILFARHFYRFPLNADMFAFAKQTAKATLFFFLLLFLAGRIGLVLHEFGGHALVWELMGGKVDDFRLFLFGGGWVRYGAPPQIMRAYVWTALIPQLSGIAVEMAGGILLAQLVKTRKTDRVLGPLFSATASVLIVHSLFYLFVCAYYGSGDGAALYGLMHGGARAVFLSFTGVLTICGALTVALAFAPAVTNRVADGAQVRRLGIILLAAFTAALLHGIVTVGERMITRDPVYAEITKPPYERLQEAELLELVETYTRKHGGPPSRELLNAVKEKLRAKHRPFPLELVLAIAAIIAMIGGFYKSAPRTIQTDDVLGWKEIGILGGLSAMAAALILVLNAL